MTALNIDATGTTNPNGGVPVTINPRDSVDVYPNRSGGAGARSCTQLAQHPLADHLEVCEKSSSSHGKVFHNRVTLGFQPPPSCTADLQWEVEVKSHRGGGWSKPSPVTQHVGCSKHYFTINGLEAETLYSFRVRSCCSNGAGQWTTLGPVQTKKKRAAAAAAAAAVGGAPVPAATPVLASAPAPTQAAAAASSSEESGSGRPQKKQRTALADDCNQVVDLSDGNDGGCGSPGGAGQASPVAAAAAAGGGGGGASSDSTADMCVVCFDKVVNVVVRALR